MTGPALRALLQDGALTGEWVLDPRKSTIRLKTKSLGVIPVNGDFRDVSGHGTVSADGEVTGTLVVASASIETGVSKRDTHLRSAEIFDSGNHPHFTFTVDAVRPSGQDITVTGELTVRGRTKPLSFDAATTAAGPGEVCLDAQVRLNRADFGVRWKGDGLVSRTNTLIIHAVFTRR